MENNSFSTPILFLIFNRKATALKVLEEIRKQKPAKLYIAADGPRLGNEEDTRKCRETREAILNSIDWACDIKTLFRDENRGCGHAPAEAITWLFEHEEYGIILEDDILPSPNFFKFCEELLIKYKSSPEITNIAGTNFISSIYQNTDSYIFSNYSGNWGWATWRRAWENYDYNISSWDPSKFRDLTLFKFSEEQYLFFDQIFKMVHNTNISDVWDYQWWYCRLISNSLGIIPSKNLTKNIGFTEEATHTFEVADDIMHARIEELKFPLTHPKKFTIDQSFDKILSDKFYLVKKAEGRNTFKKIIHKLVKRL